MQFDTGLSVFGIYLRHLRQKLCQYIVLLIRIYIFYSSTNNTTNLISIVALAATGPGQVWNHPYGLPYKSCLRPVKRNSLTLTIGNILPVSQLYSIHILQYMFLICEKSNKEILVITFYNNCADRWKIVKNNG